MELFVFSQLYLLILFQAQTSKAERITATLGEDVQLPCRLNVDYNRIRSLMWLKDGTVIISWYSQKNDLLERYPSKYNLIENTTLKILHVSGSDIGSFHCEISSTNELWISDPIQLQRAVPSASVIKYADVGENLTLDSCPNSGFAHLDWMKYDEIILRYYPESGTTETNYPHKYLLVRNTSLVIVNVTQMDAGDYWCKLSSPPSLIFQDFTGYVIRLFIPELHIDDCVYGLTNKECDCFIQRTTHGSLNCRASGFPHPPSMTWSNQTDEISSIRTAVWSSTLDISLIQGNSSFTCHATIFSPKLFTTSKRACDFHGHDEFIQTRTTGMPRWTIAIIVISCIIALGFTAFGIYRKKDSFQNCEGRSAIRRHHSSYGKKKGEIPTHEVQYELTNEDEGIRMDECTKDQITIGTKTNALRASRNSHAECNRFDESDAKIFNDPIHGSIRMPIYCKWIIDTPEFQRLRYIKRLNCVSFVYPTALHSVFDHSIGVSHLAGRLIKALQETNRDIRANDIACVEIAGLCRNLGRGPFSYSLQDLILPDDNEIKYQEEEQSVFLFKYLIEKNNLKQKLLTFGIGKKETEFICDLILGVDKESGKMLIHKNRCFLYQIVNNCINGIDVSTWDYVQRDAFFLGIQSAVNAHRLIPFIRLCDVYDMDGLCRKEMCFRDKAAREVNNVFFTRRQIYYSAYQHGVIGSIVIMLKDVFLNSAKHLKICGTDGQTLNLLESFKDPAAFCQVTDSIIHDIMHSPSEEEGMIKAREILHRIHTRKLYKCIVTIQHANERMQTTDKDVIKQCVMVNEKESMHGSIWQPHNFEIEVLHYNYGNSDKNPLLDIHFFTKVQDNSKVHARHLEQEEIPADLPQRFEEVTLSIYTRLPDVDRESIEQAKQHFFAKCRSLFRGNTNSL